MWLIVDPCLIPKIIREWSRNELGFWQRLMGLSRPYKVTWGWGGAVPGGEGAAFEAEEDGRLRLC